MTRSALQQIQFLKKAKKKLWTGRTRVSRKHKPESNWMQQIMRSTVTQNHHWEGKCIMFKIAERWIPCFMRFVRMQLMAGRRTTIVNSFWVQIKSKIEEREEAKNVNETIPFDECFICGKWIRNEIISGGSLECVREQRLRQWKCHLLAIWISLISSFLSWNFSHSRNFVSSLFSFFYCDTEPNRTESKKCRFLDRTRIELTYVWCFHPKKKMGSTISD